MAANLNTEGNDEVILGKIEIWKKRLLDMSFSNPMLNFKFPKAASVAFHDEPASLWQKLVTDHRTLDFPFASAATTPADDGQPAKRGRRASGGADNDKTESETVKQSGDETAKEMAQNDDLCIECSCSDLQKLLKNISKKGRQFQDDKGVNVVYISAGFIRWREKPDSSDWYLSPLLMLPVELISRTVFSAYSMKLSGEGIVTNPTLQYKFSHDYGVSLPDFEEEQSLADYVARIETAIGKYSGSAFGWEIVPRAALGLFPFSNICIYRDLEANSQQIAQSPLIRGICGDFSENSLLNSYARSVQRIQNSSMDEICLPENTFQIVDADSSQQEAVLCANQGISFVLQGPPGTGKSQTITNIISDALAHNRKVLFVSEKKAALDVVYERLEECGLGDFCLVLHSDKTTSREFSQQLFDVYEKLNSADTLHTSSEAASRLAELREVRAGNNSYARILHTPFTGLNRTVYEVLGELTELQNAPDAIFSFPQIVSLSSDGYSGICSALERYGRIMASTGGKPESNPWYGNIVTSADGTRRQELDALLPKLIETAERLAKLDADLKNKSGVDLGINAANLSDRLDYLSAVVRVAGVPACWHEQAVFDRLDDEIEAGLSQQETFRKTLIQLRDSAAAINPDSIAAKLPIVLDNAQERHSPDDINHQIDVINRYFARHPLMSRWSELPDPEEVGRALELIEKTRAAGADARQELERSFEPGFFELKAGPVLREFREAKGGLFKSFKSAYKDTVSQIKQYYRGSDSVDDAHVEEWLEKLHRLQEDETELNQKATECEKLFEQAWKGAATDTVSIRSVYELFSRIAYHRSQLQYALELIRLSETDAQRLSEDFASAYRGLDTPWQELDATLKVFSAMREDRAGDAGGADLLARIKDGSVDLDAAGDVLDSFESARSATLDALAEMKRLFDPDFLAGISFDNLAEKLKSCLGSYELLEESIDYRAAKARCVELGLSGALEILKSADIAPDKYVPAFRKRVCNLWLDAVYASAPALSAFRHDEQDRRIARFSYLDAMQFEIAKDRVRAAVVNSFKGALNSADPQISASFNEAASLLRAEHNKKRKHLPIRTMFMKMPQLIMQLKPCLMMSPLSVSNFLCTGTGDYKFDIVVFDEASQLRTESAIGSIFRGRQVIVAGDRHQMPPTNFFNATMDDPDDGTSDEYSDTNAYESLLDEAHALYDMTLRWHYRSKHESLIAFSNENIYGGKLVTFPSSTDQKPDVGVEYVYVEDGVYFASSNKPNPKEAEKVAEIVFEHFDKYPKRSIGVIAFGMKQQACIESAVNARLRKQPEYAKFLSENCSKPFFVKSLENVQGDERDTIILDIGYAKNENGRMIMNFGPLSNDGGERRLNVAITRAKYNLKLVGSVQPDDIVAEKVSKAGPKLLRDFIRFAQNGGKTDRMLLSEGGSYQSKFEKSVADFLTSKGYDVAMQVGTSSLRIDLAVRHPEDKGQYVIGIECDGRHYGEARTARDRDRTRQSVLKLMGWNICRVWSVSWVRNLKEEQQRLLAAVEDAIARYNGTRKETAPAQTVSQVARCYVEKGAPEILPDVVIPENSGRSEAKIVINAPVSGQSSLGADDNVVQKNADITRASSRNSPFAGANQSEKKEEANGVQNVQKTEDKHAADTASCGQRTEHGYQKAMETRNATTETAQTTVAAASGIPAAAETASATVAGQRKFEFAAYVQRSFNAGEDVKDAIRTAVETEAPVHIEFLAARLKEAGLMADKPAAKVSDQIGRMAMTLSRFGIAKSGNFLVMKELKDIAPRQVGARGTLEYVSSDEIAAGLKFIKEQMPGGSDNDVLHAAAAAFGVSSSDQKVQTVLRKALASL